MKLTLPVRAAALRARLASLHEMGSNVAEAGDLELLRADLAREVDQLSGALDRERLLVTAGISVTAPPSLDVARKRAETVLERFIAAPKAATLKRGKIWPKLLEEIEIASGDLNATLSSGWKAYRSKAFAGEAPNAIETKLAKTKSNNAAFKVYQQLYSQFRPLFDSLPADAATIKQARKLGAELEIAAKAFDFNVPPEVKAFLEAVQSVSGAPLSLLTPEVFDWLRENKIVSAYRIKSRDGA